MKKEAVLGWIAVGISTIISSLWAFIGAFESFHEGWYFSSLAANLILTCKYLGLMLIFVMLSVIAVRWPRVGASLYQLSAIGFCIWFVTTSKVPAFNVVFFCLLVILPLVFLGIVFWLGHPRPVSLAYKVSILVPLVVAAGFAAEPVTRIAGRMDDGNRGLRIVQGNGVNLIWAPEGPGWPCPDPKDQIWLAQWRGPTWEEAQKVCRYLMADGKSLAVTPQDIWRLPTVEEVVRSLTRHGANCGGAWDPINARPSYSIKPDKESPLWNPYSVIIYWWTSSEHDGRRAYSIDFNGNVYRRNKESALGSQGFRAVKSPEGK
jgi:hypothetical protein